VRPRAALAEVHGDDCVDVRLTAETAIAALDPPLDDLPDLHRCHLLLRLYRTLTLLASPRTFPRRAGENTPAWRTRVLARLHVPE
jgi:hypothetical protein